MNMWQRLGLTRRPVTALVVFAITAIVNATQFVVSGTLAHLERTPAGRHGDWWRSFTSLFVQDGGVAGTLSNLAFLLIVGVVAEQVISRPRWLVSYFGIGLIGEVFGYLWQPVGGGNSVAICGLAAAVTVAGFRRDERMPSYGLTAVIVWLGVLLATWVFPLIVLGIIPARLVQSGRSSDRIGRIVLAAAVAVGAVLCAVQNIHGGALLAGLVLAGAVALAPTRLRSRQAAGPGRPLSPRPTGNPS